MRNFLCVLAATAILSACGSDDESSSVEVSKTELLTGGSQKSWVEIDILPEDENPSCRPEANFSMDNTFTFFADGKFEFDNGTLTEDPDCQEAGCCSDLTNITGTWSFKENESRLEIIAVHKTGDESVTFDEVLIAGDLEITENTFTLSTTQGGIFYSVTFGAK